MFCFFISCSDQKEVNNTPKSTVEIKTQVQKTSITKTASHPINREPLFPQIHANLNGMVSEFVREMFQDSKGNYWFGTNGDGVIRYDGKSLEKFTINEGFGGTAVRGIKEDKEGNVWFGTSGGLTKYDGESFITYSKKGDFLDNEIWSLEIHQSGLIWVGDLDGVNVFDGQSFSVFDVPHADVANADPMLSHQRVSKILQDSKGDIWFVTDGYGISIYDGKRKTFSFLSKANGLNDNHVADLLEDKQGNIWIGTYYGGVSRYDGKTFTNFTKDGITEGKETFGFYEDSKDNIWFSAENNGVYRFDGNSFSQFTTKDGLTTDGIMTIYEDKKGQLWFSSWSGLSIYDGKSFSDAKDKEAWTQ